MEPLENVATTGTTASTAPDEVDKNVEAEVIDVVVGTPPLLRTSTRDFNKKIHADVIDVAESWPSLSRLRSNSLPNTVPEEKVVVDPRAVLDPVNVEATSAERNGLSQKVTPETKETTSVKNVNAKSGDAVVNMVTKSLCFCLAK
jgi:hypothetical protein